MEFSEKLKILRTEANLTQNELADILHVSRQAISNYEQGRGYPSIEILVEMCKFFQTSLDELLSCGGKKLYMKWVLTVSIAFFFSILLSAISVLVSATEHTETVLYVIFEAAIYFVPFLCFLVYLIFQFNPPKKANKLYGYRTKLSMTNQLSWDYAQNCFSLLYAKLSIALIALNLLYSLTCVFLNGDICFIIFCVLVGAQCLSLLLPIFFVEPKLKKLLKK